MPKPKISSKHLQIDKANQFIIVAASVCAVIVVFGLFIGRSLLVQRGHQARVIAAKEEARDQLKKNIEAKNQIVKSYQAFVATERNIIKGSTQPGQNGERDGDNARIVLDALPSKYDFPALTSSVEKLLVGNQYTIQSISGTDDEVAQTAVEPKANPDLVEVPFGFEVKEANYDSAASLFSLLERSIRPIRVTKVEIFAEGEQSALGVKVDAVTYYQPEKIISITTKVVR